MMNIDAIIEKGPDGMYSVRSDQHIGNGYFGGFGETVSEAKEDFMESIHEVMEDTGHHDEVNVSFRYDLPSFFNDFDYINASKFAQYAGINESKMRQYKCGTAYPNEKTTEKILSAIKRIGAELCSVSL